MSAPRSLAIIPDGNRRWAKRQGLSPMEGHRRSLYNGRCLVAAAFDMGVQFVTIWAASISNLKLRSAAEVQFLLYLVRSELKDRLRRNERIRFYLRGDWVNIIGEDPIVMELSNFLERKTTQYHGRQLTILFGYDGERDIEQAAQKLHDKGVRPTRELLRANLWTSHLPDTDLIIRTGVEGDPHDSDAFLPLQRKNTQIYNTEALCPDFTEENLRAACANFAARERRMGA